MPRLPVNPPYHTTPHGAFGAVRKSAADGACGWRGIYPCTHNGVDLAAKKGTPVYAPERMRVLLAATDNVTPGLRGFGPGAVRAVGVSGAVHVLGHLDPKWWSEMVLQLPGSIFEGFIGKRGVPAEGKWFNEGEQVGIIAKDHTHWEVTVAKQKVDPVKWASGTLSVATAPSGGGQSWVLLLLLLGMASSKRR